MILKTQPKAQKTAQPNKGKYYVNAERKETTILNTSTATEKY
jgi:hypothetical protein